MTVALDRHRGAGPRPRGLWIAYVGVVAIACLTVVIPAWHVQPFRPQSPRGMAWSFALERHGPLITSLALGAAVVMSIALWRVTARRATRAAIVSLVLIALVPAWFSRQNHFEWMFAPVRSVQYAAVADAGFLTDQDIVMGVEVNDRAVAFPIRQLAYHHLVNTEVGGVPIVATY